MSAERFEPAGSLRGTVVAPPDKSISHRALLFAAMAEGKSRVEACLDAADTRSTLEAVRALGAEVKTDRREGAFDLELQGLGLRGPAGSSGELDCGNAGTLIRLVSGWLAGCEGCSYVLDGDDSLRRRPMRRIAGPLGEMGADVRLTDQGTPPIEVLGRVLHGGVDHELDVASAQVKSCLLLAGLLADGRTTITEPAPSRNHSERMLTAMGAEVSTTPAATADGPSGASSVAIEPASALEPLTLRVPGDISSAAFHLVAAVLVPGSEVRVEGVGLNPTRTGILDVLARMGAEIEIEPEAERAGEAAGAVIVRAAKLEPVRVEGVEVPLTIDELPLVALAACFAEGESVIADAGELRHKESDRIATVAAALRALGAEVEETREGMSINGRDGIEGGTVDAAGDHRIAMLGAVAGLASRSGVEIKGMEAAAISYPAFVHDLQTLAA